MVLLPKQPLPLGWMARFFPDQLAFASVGGGFPESAQYRVRLRALLAERDAGRYVLLPAWKTPEREAGVADAQSQLAGYGLAADFASCRTYRAQVGSNRWDYQLCRLLPGAG